MTRTQIILLAAAVLTAWHLQCIALEGAIANSYPPVVQGKALSGGSSVAVDADGNRYIAVYCNTTRDFDPGPGADVQVHFGSTTYNDVFVTRYNADGSYAWTQVYAGSGDEQPFAIAVDDTHVYVAGQSSSYDARIGLNGPIVVPAGDTDAFVVALDKETGAAANWGLGGSGIQMFGGSVDDRAFGVASDGTNVYVAGHFYSNNAQIGGAGLSVATTGVADAFVIALDAATGLAANWGLSGSGIQTFAGTNDDFGRAVAADGAAVYMAGYFASTNAKIGGAGTAIGTSGSQDGFVIALDAATGAALGWGRSASGIQTFGGSTAQDRALAITVDASRVYATGYLGSTNAQLGAAGVSVSTTGLADACVVALDRTTGGAASWGLSDSGMQTFGGTSNDYGYAVAADGTHLYMAGSFGSVNARIGQAGSAISRMGSSSDAYVVALDAGTGDAINWGYQSIGVQVFAGSSTDEAFGVASDGSSVWVHGQFASTDAVVDGQGPFFSAEFDGFLLTVDASTGQYVDPSPQITSPLVCATGIGQSFVYEITASNAPTFFIVENLPSGLNHLNGKVSGIVTDLAPFEIIIAAGNAAGVTWAQVKVDVVADGLATYPPVTQGDSTSSVAVDGSGNRYTAGHVTGARDFNPGPGIDLHVSAGGKDGFVTRFNADGTYAWTQVVGGSSDDTLVKLAIDGSMLFAVGTFSSSNAQVGKDGMAVSPAGNTDGLVVALDPATGEPLSWGLSNSGLQTFGSEAADSASALAIDGGKIYVAGSISGTTTRIGATGTAIASAGNNDACIVVLDESTGAAATWGLSGSGIQTFGGTASDTGAGVVVDGSQVFLTGSFDSTNAQIGASGTSVGTSGGTDAFVLALDAATGAPSAWGLSGSGIQTFGGTGTDSGTGLALGGSLVYLAGYFASSNATIGAAGTTAGTAGGNDGFVVALDKATGAAASWGNGNSGIVTAGGTSSDSFSGICAQGTRVYLTGAFQSSNAQINASGTAIGNTNAIDVFLVALDAAAGTPAAWGLSSSGIQTFGGSGSDFGRAVVVDGSTLLTSGSFTSTDAGVGGTGTFDGTGFGSFLLPLDVATGSFADPRPFVTSPLSATGSLHLPFSYTITATNSPTSYNAYNLPEGLTHSNGVISGIPKVDGTHSITLEAANTAGTAYATLKLIVEFNNLSGYPPIVQGQASDGGPSVAADASGNRYIVGFYKGLRDFDPGIGADLRSSTNNSEDAYVTRFNADGTYAWTQTFASVGNDRGIAVAISGTTVYAMGTFSSGTTWLGGTATTITSSGGRIFVLALDAATGLPLNWGLNGTGIQKFGGGNDQGTGLACDGTNLYVTATFSGSSISIGGSGPSVLVGFSRSNEVFVAAVDVATGAAASWGRSNSGIQTFGGTGADNAYGICVSGSKIYVAGKTASTDAQIAATGTSVSTSGGEDAFVIALNQATGAAESWGLSSTGIQTFGGTANDIAYGVASDGTTVYATGTFLSSNVKVGGAGTAVARAGTRDAFVIALDASTGAAASWGRSNSGIQTVNPTSQPGFDYAEGKGIVADGTRVYSVGSTQTSLGLQVGATGPFITIAGGNDDAFIVALDAATGAPSNWGKQNSGLQFYGGGVSLIYSEDGLYGEDYGYGAALDGTDLLVRGNSFSAFGGVEERGTAYSKNMNGFLAVLDTATGASANPKPKITSTLVDGGLVGAPFSYTITATNAPTSFDAMDLPPGFTHGNGTFSGTPLTAGSYEVIIGASNAFGTTYETLTLGFTTAGGDEAPYPPVIRGLATGSPSIAVDAAGNRYVTGYFTETRDFDPTSGVDIHTSNGLGRDGYVTRFNADGTYGWTQTLSGDGDDEMKGVVVDGTTLYLSAIADGNTVRVGTGGTPVSLAGDMDTVVVALDAATGAPLTWGVGNSGLQTFGGSDMDGPNSIAVNGTQLLVAGAFESADAQIAGAGLAVASSGQDAFVLALSTLTGSAESWGLSGSGIQTFGGSLSDLGLAVASDGTNVFVAGGFTSTDAQVGAAGTVFASAGDLDAFVLALDASTGATASWGASSLGLQTFSGTLREYAHELLVDGSTLYVSGDYTSDNSSIGGSGTTFDSVGSTDVYVMALDAANGLPLSWGRSGSGVQTFNAPFTGQLVTGMAADGTHLYVCGWSTLYHAQIAETGPTLSTKSTDAYVIALDKVTGAAANWGLNGMGLQTFGGSESDYAYGMAVYGGQVLLHGNFYSTDAGVSGHGSIDSLDFNGYIVSLDGATGAYAGGNLFFKIDAANGHEVFAQQQGVPFDIRIRALDAAGNLRTDFTGTVDLSGTAILSTGSGTTAAFVNGVLASHTVAVGAAGSHRLFARLTGGTEMGASNTFDVWPLKSAPTDILLDNNSIAENQAIGAFIGLLSAVDADLPLDDHTFTLVSGTGDDDNASLTISGNELRSAQSYNYETKSTFSIRVRATDVTLRSFEKQLTISVTNIVEADLSLSKTADTTTLNAGGQVVFTLTVQNAGPEAATGVTVKDLLPAGLTYVSDSTSGANYSSATGIWNVGNVPNGGSASIDITVSASSVGGITNNAEITAAGAYDPDSTPNNASGTEDDEASKTVNVNALPVANDDSGSVDEGQSVNIDVADNDTDADNALDLTSIQIVSGATYGSLQVNTDGTVDYTHDGSENFTDSFTYTIKDASAAVSNTATVSITINAINDKPMANNDSAGVNEGQSVNIDLADNDTDADNALDLTSIQIVTGVAYGSLQVNTDGTVDYTHDGSENFSDSFTYTIKDASGAASNTATVSITINAVNDKPVAGILGSDPFYVEENEPLPFEGTGTDAEDGTNVTYAWDWDDGTPDGTAQNPSHAWDEPGVYIVTLVVTDQDGLSSTPVTVQVIVTPKAGERDLFLKRGKFLVNWKAHNDGIDKDTLSVQGWLNPAGCNANLASATFELSVNGVSIGVVPLAANGKGSASFGTALAKASLKAKTGAFSFSIKDADLRTALGLSNTTEAGDLELAVEISVQNAGLSTDTFTAHAQFDYTTKQDIYSKGNFNFKTGDSADGYLFAAKTSVTEDKTGKHKVSTKGYFDAPGGESIVPSGDVTLTIGTQSITIPAASLTVSSGVISLPKGAHPDLAKFILDTNKELFTILTNALPGTGVPPVGAPVTSHDLLIRIEIPTAGDLVTFETTVEILRSSTTSKVWKR